MNLKYFRNIFLTLIAVSIVSCDTYKQDDYVEQYVLEAILTAGESFPPVKLSTTLPVAQTYSFDAAAISNAQIVIAQGTTTTITYIESENRGVYIPEDETAIVEPGLRYALEVTNLRNSDERITANSFVPGALQFLDINITETFYQSPEQFEITFVPGSYPGRQNVYVATSLALDPINFDLTPFWADQDSEPFEFIRVSSGLVNEGNYDLNDDGSITLKYPWIGISYFGPNELSIFAVDTNIFDYQRSLNIQGGGANISPGQIENVLWNVEGGIGLFGSRTGISVDVYVKNLVE